MARGFLASGQSLAKTAWTSRAGVAFKEGVIEQFGWEFNKAGKSIGFLGRKGPDWAKTGMGMRAFKFLLGPAAMGYSIYSGYQQGGVIGAAKEGAVTAIVGSVFRNAFIGAKAVFGSAALGVAAGVAAAGFAGYKFVDASRKHGRKLRNVEMGGGVIDPYGTGATVRRRSLEAIQHSKINGRMALGNEAILMHIPMR